MRGNDLLENMECVQPAYIEEAAAPVKKKKATVKWVALAACLCLAVYVGFLVRQGIRNNAVVDSPAAATGFQLNDTFYFPIGFEDRKYFGLLDESEIGLNAENTYKITKKDLGEKIGSIELPSGDGTVTVDVYRFASLPEYDAICIADLPGGYAFYTADGLMLTEDQQAVSDRILNAYGMPDSITELSVRTDSGTVLHTITDPETIDAFCSILSGKENIGLLEKEKMAAKLWYDTYGNEDVYFDETEGFIKFNTGDYTPQEPQITTDADGNEIVYYPPNEESYVLNDAATALWCEGERDVIISTDRGFRVFMIFQPSMGTVTMYDGCYVLSKEEVTELSALLG